MNSTRFSRVLIAACLAAAASCSDSATSTTTPRTQIPTVNTPTLVTLTGMIRTGEGRDQLSLEVADRGNVMLGGTEIGNLTSLENDEVEVRGTWAGILDGNDVFVVSDFIVRQVGGVDALDGILTTLYDDETGTQAVGYAINLTGGSSVPLLDPPQELINHLGERVWVTTSADGKPDAFGVIGAATT